MVYKKNTRPTFEEGMCFYRNPLSPRSKNEKAVYIEIPDEKSNTILKDGIAYGEDRDWVADNEFEVPDAELVEFNDLSATITEAFKASLYTGAATLKGMDTANDYVGAALNDGLDLGIEMDERPFDAFVHLARLQVLTAAVDHLKLHERQKSLLLSYLTKALAEKAIEAMTLADTAQKRSKSLQDHFRALVRPTEKVDSSDTNDKKLAVKRSRL